MYNIKRIRLISDRYPWLGRTIEIGILGAIYYFLGVLITGDVFNLQAFLLALLGPIHAGVNKALRDLQKKDDRT